MGTRNLTAVFSGGEYKVAQYGQWDGYPSGQGSTILKFLHTLSENIYRNKFLEQLDKLTFISTEELELISKRINDEKIDNWSHIWPELSRDTGGEILGMVMRSESPLKLRNQINFAADSLFCEYAYVVDFDKNTFEVFQGFNKSPLSESDRFYGYVSDDKGSNYHPVRLVKSYELSDLPSLEQFIADLTPLDDSEE